MVIREKAGNLNTIGTCNKTIDWLDLEWYEASKRIMHKKSRSGMDVVMKFMNENQNLTQGDVLFQDDQTIIAVNILPCQALVIKPKSMYQMACICYEIGNKHLPLFYQNEAVLVAFDAPLFRLISSLGYDVVQGMHQLVNPLKTTVAAHGHSGGSGETLFSKIMRLTNPTD